MALEELACCKPQIELLPRLGKWKQSVSRINFSLSNLASIALPNAPYPRFCCRAASTSESSVEYTIPSSSTKIFIKGLPLSISEVRLTKVFSGFGEVTQVKILIDKESGQSLGFAYISFDKEESAQLAAKEMNGKFFDGRFIYVSIAKPGSSKSWKRTTAYKF
ncbi:glycine-rich RNA-binding protein 4, mitochondrial [Cicer arietinum]|uniref:Glycine-rich RNA-binding protein 4, mitochondrial n=1 Tax=Cicer arietinum TaxID=3827 RepID=A0A1S2YQJ1_CICAR|nr:glycine-rich RNA-binding protein 4, mitochondrial [Cicer arietinum]